MRGFDGRFKRNAEFLRAKLMVKTGGYQRRCRRSDVVEHPWEWFRAAVTELQIG